MPVIINELEVIAAPPPAQEGDDMPVGAEQAAVTGPTAGDVESIIRRLVMRGLRVCAD